MTDTDTKALIARMRFAQTETQTFRAEQIIDRAITALEATLWNHDMSAAPEGVEVLGWWDSECFEIASHDENKWFGLDRVRIPTPTAWRHINPPEETGK